MVSFAGCGKLKVDAEAVAFVPERRELFAGVSGRQPVAALLAFVVARGCFQRRRFRVDLVRVHGQGASGSWCCMIRRPKLSALVAAFGSLSAANSRASPAGSPLR